MGHEIGEWLLRKSTVFGIPFQHWMSFAVGIMVAWVLYDWIMHRSR